MAEIKSTMEMVLERAAKMAEAAPQKTENEDLIKVGMRLAAEYINNKEINLGEELTKHPSEDQLEVRKGMAKTLLRNVVLPRDEDLLALSDLALKGVLNLAGNSGEIQSICQELGQILEQYSQHKDQTTQQLEDALKSQIQQQQMASGQEIQGEINAAMHPQYREELSKMLTSLNGQYNDAMDQRKEMILQRLAPSQQ